MPVRGGVSRVLGGVALAVILTSCGLLLARPTPTPPPTTEEYAWQHPRNACEVALTRDPLPASSVAEEDLVPMFSTCTVAELSAGRDYLGIHSVDTPHFVNSKCSEFPSLSETQLCQDAG